MKTSLRSALGVLALVPLLAACGSSSSSSSHAQAAAPSSTAAAPSSTASTAPAKSGATAVKISGYAFHPVSITVKPGTKITFTNSDQTAHTATSTKSGVFDTGTVNPGASKTILVSKPGTYTYYCQFHAFMHGTVTVQ